LFANHLDFVSLKDEFLFLDTHTSKEYVIVVYKKFPRISHIRLNKVKKTDMN